MPQYQLVNQGFGIDGFKQIFWLEWVHRLWGRLIGLFFIVPLIWLWARGAIPRRMVPRLVLLFVLGGLQGAVGWFMVASGFFPDSTAVSPFRLEIHLALAVVLYAALLWTGLSVLRPDPGAGSPVLRRFAIALVALVSLTILAGGVVAGLHAGLSYNTFPFMDGRLVPAGYLTDSIATAQFDHRLLATATALTAAVAVVAGLRLAPGGLVRAAVVALGVTVALQYLLGISTLLLVVPVGLATAHQVTAVLVLTAALVLLHTLRRN
jgi:cytochrome c oxidase assembly protein subunit 15